MNNLEDLLKEFANRILQDELKKSEVKYHTSNVIVWPIKSVGVQGDNRTYSYPIEIEIIYDGKFLWEQEKFIRNLSNRITNEVKIMYNGEQIIVNKVLYSLKINKDN